MFGLRASGEIGEARYALEYADYDAEDFGVNTRRFWVQAEYAF